MFVAEGIVVADKSLRSEIDFVHIENEYMSERMMGD